MSYPPQEPTSVPPGRRTATKLKLTVTALVVALLATLAPGSASAAAYPYDNSANCANQFGIYSWCRDHNGDGRYQSAEQFSRYAFAYRNCTDYVAWKINSLGVNFHNTMGGGRFSNAKNWDNNARTLGWKVSTTPRKHAIAVSEAGTYGHVAFVESVNGNGTVNVSEYNKAGDGMYGTRTDVRFDSYIYVPGLTKVAAPAVDLSKYARSIVKWDGDSRTAWYVTPDLKRLWIPDSGTYQELKARGAKGPHVLSSTVLDKLPDQRGRWAASGPNWTKNRTLRRGMGVRSSDGRYRFVMQGDGNLVLYGPSGQATWATSWQTSKWRDQKYVVFQSDGNLVTYTDVGRPVWHTGTHGTKADRFAVQSDGNLVIYRGQTAVWASGTAGRR